MTIAKAEEQARNYPRKDEHDPGAEATLRQKILFSVSVVLGGLAAYLFRQSMNVDGISYLDIASAYVRHDWSLAISGYWSPLYCWLLAVFLKTFTPSMGAEYPVVHLANFACYLFALFGFYRFWGAYRSYQSEASSDESSSLAAGAPWLWETLGYTLFLYLFLQLIKITTPDVLSSGFIFLTAEQVLRWRRKHEHSFGEVSCFALILASGFFAKAILLYFGVFVLAALFFERRRSRVKTLLVGVLFLGLITPWMVAIHRYYGQFTFGYSGKLNYSWFVNGTPAGELLDPNGTSLPYYPGPQISPEIPAFAIRTAPNVTYWPWFDPVRMAHINPIRLNIARQLRTVVKNLVWLRTWFLVEFGAITFVVAATWMSVGWRGVRGIVRDWVLWMPIVLIFGMYGLVFIRSFRYTAAFTVILFGIALGSVRIQRQKLPTLRAVTAAGLLMFGIINFPGTVKGAVLDARDAFVQEAVAEAVNKSGVHRGDVVGVVHDETFCYWAQLARVSVGAEVWVKYSRQFWQAAESKQSAVACTMQHNGVKAVIGRPPEGLHPMNWFELGNTGYFRFVGSCR